MLDFEHQMLAEGDIQGIVSQKYHASEPLFA
jgi:hypothetical protein